MQEEFNLYDVFTPSSPAKVNFINRKFLTDRVISALNIPGKQIVIFGYSGVGKTSLLMRQLEKIYENEIITPCMIGMTFESILLDAFDQLDEYYISQKNYEEKNSIESSLTNDYFNIKATLKASSHITEKDTLARLVSVQLTASRLADFLGKAKSCWVLEDFHKIDNDEKKKLSQAMKIFMDKSTTYRELKIIALGAVNTGREVVGYDNEMKKRISEIEISLMSPDEIKEIIICGEKYLNIEINHNIKNDIVKFSNGLASICHSICLYMCEEKGVYSTQKEQIIFQKHDLEKAVHRHMEEESDTMKERFNKALVHKKEKFKNAKLILNALTKFPADGATNAELLSVIKDERFEYSQSNLTIYLAKLQEEDKGSLIRFDNSSAKYSFSEPFYKPFALALFQEEDKVTIDIKHSLKTIIGRMAYEILVEEQLTKHNITK